MHSRLFIHHLSRIKNTSSASAISAIIKHFRWREHWVRARGGFKSLSNLRGPRATWIANVAIIVRKAASTRTLANFGCRKIYWRNTSSSTSKLRPGLTLTFAGMEASPRLFPWPFFKRLLNFSASRSPRDGVYGMVFKPTASC